VLLECPGAKQAWHEVQLWDTIDSTLRKNYNMDALIFTLTDQLPLVQRELFVTIMWSLWKRRNLKLWQQQNETIMQVMERAKHLLEEWRIAQNIRTRREDVPLTHQGNSNDGNVVEWSKSAYGRYKCNINASFSSSMHMVGIGICFRDDMGEFISAKTDCFSPLCDVDVGEAIGFHTALRWMTDLHYDNIDFALDSKIVVDHFWSHVEVDNDSEFGCIMSACRQMFENSFQNSHVEFNMRQVNGVTHELAKVAPYNASSHVYDNVSSCISSLIDDEKQ